MTFAHLFLAWAALAAPPSQETPGPEPGPKPAPEGELWVTYEPAPDLPGAGKHVVWIAGDEEYRSEESLPMLAKILARRHGFRCTVLFSTDPGDGTIDPMNQTHIPGMPSVAEADLVVLMLRFRELPDADMKPFADHVEAGKPVVGIRTATHAFDYRRNPESPFRRYTWRGGEWDGGFGRRVLGETWVAHHGGHGSQSTRGRPAADQLEHPILRGWAPIWGPTDVYAVRELPADATVLVHGLVVDGMSRDDPVLAGPKNDPPMPLIWCRDYPFTPQVRARSVCSTIGSARDFESEGLRRVLVNACYWALGLEEAIPAASDVAYVGEYRPTPFGHGRFQRNLRARDHALPD